MEIPLFLAMTAGEVLGAEQLPRQLAWMACHFSPYGMGLSNLPDKLPDGTMLILNDRLPPEWHDPVLAAQILVSAAQERKCSCILLDFQRAGNEKTASVVEAVLEMAQCPVGVSHGYAEGRSCPVLIPPVPPHMTLEEHLAPWQGREIWLEVGYVGTEITVTAEGSRYTSLPCCRPDEGTHVEPELGCHYEIEVSETEIRFRLGRTEADLKGLIATGAELGVTRAVGLWQELGYDGTLL